MPPGPMGKLNPGVLLYRRESFNVVGVDLVGGLLALLELDQCGLVSWHRSEAQT